MFFMGGILAGIVEEAAFRGYMQTGLEQHDPDNAGNHTFVWDTKLGGFALAVSETGRKSFIIQYRSHRVSRRMKTALVKSAAACRNGSNTAWLPTRRNQYFAFE